MMIRLVILPMLLMAPVTWGAVPTSGPQPVSPTQRAFQSIDVVKESLSSLASATRADLADNAADLRIHQVLIPEVLQTLDEATAHLEDFQDLKAKDPDNFAVGALLRRGCLALGRATLKLGTIQLKLTKAESYKNAGFTFGEAKNFVGYASDFLGCREAPES